MKESQNQWNQKIYLFDLTVSVPYLTAITDKKIDMSIISWLMKFRISCVKFLERW